MIKVIAALGNPGAEYVFTRHNIAWLLLEQAAFLQPLQWKNKFAGFFSKIQRSSGELFLLKPQTFMNRSGDSVRAAMDFFRISPPQLLVIHDDIELEFGIVGFKSGGGLGGHNGLRSVSHALNSRDFQRFRLGISRPAAGNVTDHVLGSFSRGEEVELATILTDAAHLLEECLEADFDQFQKRHAKLRLPFPVDSDRHPASD